MSNSSWLLLAQDSLGTSFLFDPSSRCDSTNPFDRWILAYAQSLIKFFHEEMQAYRLYTVLPRLLKFVDNLTNWYIRFNRKRLKGQNGDDDAWNALWTLGEVLLSLSKLMAPVTPFFTEWVYQRLRPYLARAQPSEWSNSQVSTWLASVGLSSYTELFQQHGIKGMDLLDLSHEDLTSMGISRCTDRKAVLRYAFGVSEIYISMCVCVCVCVLRYIYMCVLRYIYMCVETYVC